MNKIKCPNQDNEKRKNESQEEPEKLVTQVADYEQEQYEKELLLHVPVISKPHTNSLQTKNGFNAIIVYHSGYGAEQKIQMRKGCRSIIQIQKDEAV